MLSIRSNYHDILGSNAVTESQNSQVVTSRLPGVESSVDNFISLTFYWILWDKLSKLLLPNKNPSGVNPFSNFIRRWCHMDKRCKYFDRDISICLTNKLAIHTQRDREQESKREELNKWIDLIGILLFFSYCAVSYEAPKKKHGMPGRSRGTNEKRTNKNTICLHIREMAPQFGTSVKPHGKS